MKLRFLIPILLALAPAAFAQNTPAQRVIYVTADPAGACSIATPLQYNTTNGKLWGCDAGTWTQVSGGSGSMTWPSAPGITVCSGTPCTAWGTSLTAPSGALVGAGQANTYTTGLQDFSLATVKFPATATVGSSTITFPGSTSTLATLGANTFTGAQTLGTTLLDPALGTTTPKLIVGSNSGQPGEIQLFKTTTTTGDATGFYLNYAQTATNPTPGSSLSGLLVQLGASFSGTSTSGLTALSGQATVNGTGAAAGVSGVRSIVGSNGSGRITNAIGYYSDASFTSTATVDHFWGFNTIIGVGPGAGTLTDYKGFYYQAPQIAGASTITNQYAFYAESVTGATGLNYAIFTGTGQNRLGDLLTLNPPANTSALVSTGYSLTGSDAHNLFDFAGTWNTSGVPTAMKVNITDTASDTASLLMDLEVGGTSKFKVRKDGVIVGTLKATGQFLIPNGSAGAPGIASAASPNSGISFDPTFGDMTITIAGTNRLTLNSGGSLGISGLAMGAGGTIKYGLASTGSGTALLASNSPAITVSAPYTWLQVNAPDGSIVYLPAWK